MTLTLNLAENCVRAGREHAATLGVAACHGTKHPKHKKHRKGNSSHK